MAEPSRYLRKLAEQLGLEPSDRTAFLAALTEPQPYPKAILWRDRPPTDRPFPPLAPLPWQPDWIDRLAPTAQPGKQPIHAAGAYYCLDFSSVFAASVMLSDPPPSVGTGLGRGTAPIVIDLCAAPGGKSVFAWRALRPEWLIANEAIAKRLKPLIANLKRCQIAPVAVCNRDPKILAERLPACADWVLVDAPCSGQSLLAKGETNPGCFHPVNVNKNANRQKRILAHATTLVAPGGYLAYMTCTYAPAENEAVGTWLGDRFPAFTPVAVPHLAPWRSPLVPWPGYRMLPHTGLGAGSFVMLWQREATGERRSLPTDLAAAYLQKPDGSTLAASS